MITDGVTSKIYYLARDPRFETEKPFKCLGPIDAVPGAVQTNQVVDAHIVNVHDVRHDPDFGLDTTGWTFMKHKADWLPHVFDSNTVIEQSYYPEIEQLLKRNFPRYSRILFLDHSVRKRSTAYPDQVGATTESLQPLSLAHCDLSANGAISKIQRQFHSEPELSSEHFDVLNVWRVLEGPNNDWPLAVCDFRSVDTTNDPIDNDVVYTQSEVENTLLHANPAHKWHWMSDMDTDDVIIFRNTSKDPLLPRAWHAAFEVPTEHFKQDFLRSSVEVRVLAIYR